MSIRKKSTPDLFTNFSTQSIGLSVSLQSATQARNRNIIKLVLLALSIAAVSVYVATCVYGIRPFVFSVCLVGYFHATLLFAALFYKFIQAVLKKLVGNLGIVWGLFWTILAAVFCLIALFVLGFLVVGVITIILDYSIGFSDWFASPSVKADTVVIIGIALSVWAFAHYLLRAIYKQKARIQIKREIVADDEVQALYRPIIRQQQAAVKAAKQQASWEKMKAQRRAAEIRKHEASGGPADDPPESTH